jgi:transposase
LTTTGIARATRKGCPNHPIDFKRQLAALACVPNVSVAKLALKHGVNANLLFKWRRQYRAGKFGAPLPDQAVTTVGSAEGIAPRLLPVLTVPEPRPVRGASAMMPEIEIVLGRATLRVRGAVDARMLTTVLDCLAARA